MTELKETALRAERAWLVGVHDDKIPKAEAESLLAELASLAKTLGVEAAGSTLVKLRERHAALLLGTGKADEIVAVAKAEGVDSILFDHALTPTQQRNWEKLADLKVYDRSELIIRIFAGRALTREAVLQVELAELEYSLPRLAHSYEALSRQRGGRYGTKGSGEQKIELDRREIEKRIHEIKEELKEVRKSRDVMRRRREKSAVPRAAVVGYTNAGKSSLLNALTKASVLAEDKLFATLDPTTRRIALSKGGTLLLTDTVGFVRNLPHHLVEAFKSTLEEAAGADLLVHVVDAADPEAETHLVTTEKVLAELFGPAPGRGLSRAKAEEEGRAQFAATPRILVLNKVDLAEEETLARWRESHPEAVHVSAKTGSGLAELIAAVEAGLRKDDAVASYRVPYAEHALVAALHREAQVLEESREDEGTLIRARVPERLRARFESFKVED